MTGFHWLLRYWQLKVLWNFAQARRCCIKYIKLILGGLVLSAIGVTIHYQNWVRGLVPEISGSTEAVARELVARQLIPGISFAVIEDKRITQTLVLGVADLETGRVNTAETLFEAASLTKPLIAEIARRLYVDGLFSLDELVAQSISNPRVEKTDLWQQVTVRHLLAHSAGFPNWTGDSREVDRDNPLQQDFVPGTDFQYSGEGYGLLLEFLEAKSGRTMVELCDELFAELGMTRSIIVTKNSNAEFARGHWINVPSRHPWRTEQPIAAWSMMTNAEDYGRFMLHVMQNLSDDFAEPQVEVDEMLSWSLGWGVLEKPEHRLHFQWGDNGPFKALAVFNRSSGDGVVYFINGSLGTYYADNLVAPVLGDISEASSWFSDPRLEYVRRWVGF